LSATIVFIPLSETMMLVRWLYSDQW